MLVYYKFPCSFPFICPKLCRYYIVVHLHEVFLFLNGIQFLFYFIFSLLSGWRTCSWTRWWDYLSKHRDNFSPPKFLCLLDLCLRRWEIRLWSWPVQGWRYICKWAVSTSLSHKYHFANLAQAQVWLEALFWTNTMSANVMRIPCFQRKAEEGKTYT